MKPKEELIRMVKPREGNIALDANNIISGKGIYVCRELNCLQSFVVSKKFRRRFHDRLEQNSLEELKMLVERFRNM
jgi:predicted RNA-binding protein YlxR (DUF448 family)